MPTLGEPTELAGLGGDDPQRGRCWNEPTKTLSPSTRTTFGRSPTVISRAMLIASGAAAPVGVAVAVASVWRVWSRLVVVPEAERDRGDDAGRGRGQQRGAEQRRAARRAGFGALLEHSLSLSLRLSLGSFPGGGWPR